MSHQPVISDGQTMGTMGMRFVLEGRDGKVGVPHWRDVYVFNFKKTHSHDFSGTRSPAAIKLLTVSRPCTRCVPINSI